MEALKKFVIKLISTALNIVQQDTQGKMEEGSCI